MTLEALGLMSNGYVLYREPNGVGGHRYFSEEVGGGVVIWDTCLVSKESLLAAIEAEEKRLKKEAE